MCVCVHVCWLFFFDSNGTWKRFSREWSFTNVTSGQSLLVKLLPTNSSTDLCVPTVRPANLLRLFFTGPEPEPAQSFRLFPPRLLYTFTLIVRLTFCVVAEHGLHKSRNILRCCTPFHLLACTCVCVIMCGCVSLHFLKWKFSLEWRTQSLYSIENEMIVNILKEKIEIIKAAGTINSDQDNYKTER